MNRNNLPIAPDLTKTTERFTATIPKFNKNGSYARARMRGVILSPIGWQRFQAAKQQAELEEIWGKHFTQENLSARTALFLNTRSRIFKREQGVARQSLEYLFQAFRLELTTADFTSPTASWEELLSQRSNPQQDWDNAVDTSVFYGRDRELVQLWQWIVSDRCRVVALLGIAGIGKSTLAVKAALQMQAEFEIVVWRSLSNTPPLDELLSSLLKFFLPIYREDPAIPNTLDEKISKLMEYLRSQRCLLILDNAEAILQGQQVGQWRSGYEAYGQFLIALGETPHQSCCLLTSREKSQEIVLMEGEQSPVKALFLSGLTLDDVRAIFQQKGAFTGSETQWQILIDRYGGNPLVLKLVATATQYLFDGSIAEVLTYLDRGIFVFEDIRHLLDCQFDRLSEDEQKTLFWFAIYREPVAIADICESVVGSVAGKSVPQQINSLIRRSLLKKTDGLFCLQPYVLAYVTERLIQQICTEFETQQMDVLQSHSLIGVSQKDCRLEMQLRSIVQLGSNDYCLVLAQSRRLRK
jgi:hypothetical protein